MKQQHIQAQASTPPFPIAIVVSQFNHAVTEKLLAGALARLAERDVPDDMVTVVCVPGAIEISLIAYQLAASQRYKAIITLGAVIRGETGHYDFVCRHVTDGCLRASLDHGLPVIFGVLTTDTAAQAMDRVGGAHGHKGRDAVDAAFDTVSVLRQL